MGILSLNLPITGKPDTSEDPKIITAFTAIQTLVNGNIEASNVKAGSLTGDRLTNATIEDSKVAAGRALVNTENSYSVATARALNTQFTPSTTRMVFVVLRIKPKHIPPTIEAKLLVQGVEIFQFAAAGQEPPEVNMSCSFLCPPNQHWEVTSAGGWEALTSAYLIL